MGTGYGQVFTVPLGYCDEGPLVIEGLPAECAFSQGWRNYLSDSPEAFLLEPLDVVLFTIDELIAGGLQIAPEDAQLLRTHEFRMGYMAGVVQTAVGDQGFQGLIVSAQDESGVFSAWTPAGLLSPDDCTLLRELRNCAGTVRNSDSGWDDPTHPGWACKDAYNRCMQRATDDYKDAMEEAKEDFEECVRRSLDSLDEAVALCVAAALASNLGAIPLILVCGGVYVVSSYVNPRLGGCYSDLRAAEGTAKQARDAAYNLCLIRREICIALAQRDYERQKIAEAPSAQPPEPRKPQHPQAPQEPGRRIRR